MSKSKNNLHRSASGSAMIDYPLALWILFLGLTFPMIDMATVAWRATFFTTASRDGVHTAARSATYHTNLSTTNVSAINGAQSTVTTDASAFNGITITSVNTYILATNITTQVTTRYSAPLTAPADISNYVYELQTVVTGTVAPLIPFKSKYLPTVPGLTGPITLTVSSQEFSEYPQGLNQ